jgi:Spy/CpxP family protein refolding chaperone
MRTYLINKIGQLEDLIKIIREEHAKEVAFLFTIMTAEQRKKYRDYLTNRREEVNQEWVVEE